MAELPQIAIPTVISADSGDATRSRRANHVPSTRASVTTATMATTLVAPVSMTCSTVRRAPSSAIPTRRAHRAAIADPGQQHRPQPGHVADRETDRQRHGGPQPQCQPHLDEPRRQRDDDAGQQAGQRRAMPARWGRWGQSRTRGGLSRSNMWTVSTKRTCLV